MSEDLVISDINGICRLCLKGDGTIIPIFGRENTSRDCIPLSKKIFNCVSIEVIDGDGMSSMICVGCVHQVDSWNGFKNTCESSQKKLMQWLHKNKPDVFEKNEARRHARSLTSSSTSEVSDLNQVNGRSSAVIDLSSDDDEPNITSTKKPAPTRLIRSHHQRSLNKPTNRPNKPTNRPTSRSANNLSPISQPSHSQNFEVISLSSSEIEIFPVNNTICESGNLNTNIPLESTSSPTLPDVADAVNKDINSEDPSSSDGQILPDTEAMPETSATARGIQPEEQLSPETLSTSKVVAEDDDNVFVNNIPSVNEENDSVASAASENNNPIIQINVSNTEFMEGNPVTPRETGLAEETGSFNSNDGDPLAEKESSSSSKDETPFTGIESSNSTLDQITLGENRDLDKDLLRSNNDSSQAEEESENMDIEKDTVNVTVQLISSNAGSLVQPESEQAEKPTEDSAEASKGITENSVDNSATFMIGEVTSLSNNELAGEREPEDDMTDDYALDDDQMNQSRIDDDHDEAAWSSQEENTSDVRPDIVMCDSPTQINIKEEPVSEGEEMEEAEVEDPLGFQTVLIKNESDPVALFESELGDVKPNLSQLDEVMSNQYSPKRLKCGKPYCEPCRVSFSTYVSYERHTLSLRHKLNFKLFKSGRGPTKIGTRGLKTALMANVQDVPIASQSRGPYSCNYCPSKFRHLRNLRTHQKKLMHGYVRRERQPAPVAGHQQSVLDQSSKPPVRQSARNLSFAEIPETQCELCNHTFNGLKGLISHKRFCGLSGSHACHCKRIFSTAALLLKHKRECESHLMNQKLLSTSRQTPGRNSDSPLPASSPSPVPSRDEPVVACTLCNFNFHSSKDLITHMQQNHMDFGKPQSPAEVPNFAKPNQFSGLRDSSLHYCKYCPRSFPTYGALSSHTGYHARKSVYFCKFCRQNHRDKVSFRQHMRVHISDPSNRNVCWICYTPFNSQADLADHKKNHAMKMTIFPCTFCGNSYNTKELLIKHKRAEHYRNQPTDLMNDEMQNSVGNVQTPEKQVQIIDEDYRLFKCKICKKRFTTLGNLQRHAKAHKYGVHPVSTSAVSQHSEQSGYHRCSLCFKAFRTHSGLLNHKPFCSKGKPFNIPTASSTIPGSPVKCKGCKKWFASKNSLYKHTVMGRCLGEREQPRAETVSAVRPKNCTNCDQQFLSEETLSRHKQSCKPTMDRLTCDCGEVFSSVESKLEHAETCSANCTCKVCNMKFNSPEELESHRLVCGTQQTSSAEDVLPENQPQLECHKCSKRFVYSKCLQMHLDKCMYNRWPCSSCQQVFPSESAMALHRKTSCHKLGKSPGINQVNASPVKCEYCHLRFSSQDDLIQHSFTCQNQLVGHRDQDTSEYRPFSCEYCGKTFIWKANMQRHVKMAHLNRMSSSPSSTTSKAASPSDNLTKPLNTEKSQGFKCQLCPDIIFHKQQGLLEHQMMHGQQAFREPDSTSSAENMLTCELCDRKLPESLYPMHMDEHMNDDFEESNNDQRLATPIKETNDQHLNNGSTPAASNESSPNGFPCDLCGKTFRSPVSRKSHRAFHFRTGQGYVSQKKLLQNKKHTRCKICNKLLSVNSIHKHNMMHAREDAEFYGGQKSLTPQSLRSSSQQPVVEEPAPKDTSAELPCPKCDQSFASRALLVDHLQVHADDNMETESTSSGVGSVDQHPYKCVYCDLSWKYKSVYERHISSKKHLEVKKQLSGII